MKDLRDRAREAMKAINGPSCRMGYNEMLNTMLAHGAYSKKREAARKRSMEEAHSPRDEWETSRRVMQLMRREVSAIKVYLEYASEGQRVMQLPEFESQRRSGFTRREEMGRGVYEVETDD